MSIAKRLQRNASALDNKTKEELVEAIQNMDDEKASELVCQLNSWIYSMHTLRKTDDELRYIFKTKYFEEVESADGYGYAFRPLDTEQVAQLARDNAEEIASAILTDPDAKATADGVLK